MAGIPTVHDHFFRAILSDKQVAIAYFQSVLPEPIAQLLDLSTIEQLSGTYVSGLLAETIADAVYRCTRRDGMGSMDISLLVEHKSRRDKYTPIQVGGYLFSGYQQQIDEGRQPLSPIIPILFYHGPDQWEYWTLDRLFGGLENELLGFIPKFDYLYNNLREASDEEIRALGHQFLMASLLALKHAHDKAWLGSNFSSVISIGLGNAEGYLGQELLLYCLHQAELSPEEARKLIKKLPETIRRQVMSTYELLKAEGKAEGFEQGAEHKSYEFVRNLIQNTAFDDAKIASLAVVTASFVQKIRAELGRKKK